MNLTRRPRIFEFLCLGLAVSLLGCDSGQKRDATVQGTVTMDGDLAKSGTVTFHSTDSAPIAYGTIRKDGTFALRIGQGNVKDRDRSEIVPGSYIATVTIRGPTTPDVEMGPGGPPRPGRRLSAAKYSSKATSGLAYTVKSGRNVINIDLEAPSPEEMAEQDEGESDEEGTETEDESGAEDAAEESAAVEQTEPSEDSLEEETPEQQSPKEETTNVSAEETSP